MIVVDDHFIAQRLAAGSLGDADEQVATTCSWWWRLSAALAGSRGGALARRVAMLDPSQRRALFRTVASLPRRILVVDIRELIPAMAALSAVHHLNQLAAEAVVVAELLGADLVVSQDTPTVRHAATARGLSYRVA